MRVGGGDQVAQAGRAGRFQPSARQPAQSGLPAVRKLPPPPLKSLLRNPAEPIYPARPQFLLLHLPLSVPHPLVPRWLTSREVAERALQVGGGFWDAPGLCAERGA